MRGLDLASPSLEIQQLLRKADVDDFLARKLFAAQTDFTEPGEHQLIDAFPGLDPDGMTVCADRATALSIFQHLRGRLSPFKRIRRIEFAELPKTISGKIRRVQLRAQEVERQAAGRRGELEWRDEDFPALRQAG